MINSLFWEFATEDNPEYSTIYGTVHLGTPECLKHWDRVARCIELYPVVFTESSLEMEDLKFLQPFTLLETGTSTTDYVTANRWRRMRRIFLKYCRVDIDLLKMFRPLFILTQIQSAMVQSDEQTALDFKIWQYALLMEKEVRGIETAQEQVSILLSLDTYQQYLNLIRISKNISATRKKLKKLLKAYEEEDIISLYRMSKSTLGKDRSSLIRNRNEVMAKRLINFHNDQASFFSFGAGHLTGGRGIIRLLKKHGAIVRPLKKVPT